MSYKVKGGKLARRSKIDPRKIDSECDIQVDAKGGQYVMLCANAVGRRVVEDVFPDVEWTTDEIFSQCHSDKWLFTHIRVTRLPPHLENRIPLAFASPDSLGFAVALFLQPPPYGRSCVLVQRSRQGHRDRKIRRHSEVRPQR
jgi:hypothetical protein